jgi:hypothetical protein
MLDGGKMVPDGLLILARQKRHTSIIAPVPNESRSG